MFSVGFAGQETRVALPEIIDLLCFLLAECRQEDKVEERRGAGQRWIDYVSRLVRAMCKAF